MLSRDCWGCSQRQACQRRYSKVTPHNGAKVYCPDGTAHLVDQNLEGNQQSGKAGALNFSVSFPAHTPSPKHGSSPTNPIHR